MEKANGGGTTYHTAKEGGREALLSLIRMSEGKFKSPSEKFSQLRNQHSQDYPSRESILQALDELCKEPMEMLKQFKDLGREYSESKAKVATANAWIANCGRSPEVMEKVWQISYGKTTYSAMAWMLHSTSTPTTLTGEISDTPTSLSTASSWLQQPPEKADIHTCFASLPYHLKRKSELEKKLLALQQRTNDLD
jgi:hypothetical protein